MFTTLPKIRNEGIILIRLLEYNYYQAKSKVVYINDLETQSIFRNRLLTPSQLPVFRTFLNTFRSGVKFLISYKNVSCNRIESLFVTTDFKPTKIFISTIHYFFKI